MFDMAGLPQNIMFSAMFFLLLLSIHTYLYTFATHSLFNSFQITRSNATELVISIQIVPIQLVSTNREYRHLFRNRTNIHSDHACRFDAINLLRQRIMDKTTMAILTPC